MQDPKLTRAQEKALRAFEPTAKVTATVKALIDLGLVESFTPEGGTPRLRRTQAGIQLSMKLQRVESMLYTKDSSGHRKKRGWGKP